MEEIKKNEKGQTIAEHIERLGNDGKYSEQGTEFLRLTDTTIAIELMGLDVPEWDGKKHNKYEITLKNKKHSYIFYFWDSLFNTEKSKKDKPTLLQFYCNEFAKNKPLLYCTGIPSYKLDEVKKAYNKSYDTFPTAYDILAAVTKYDCGTFSDFCANFGYDEDSRTAERTYIACINEQKNIERLFTNEQMEALQQIN